MAKIATNWLKMSRVATFGQSLGGHNLVIFHPILTFDHTKMISSSRGIEWWKDLSSISFRLDFRILSHFLPPVATWTTFGARTQKYPQVVGTCPAYHPQLIAQNWYPRKNLSHTPPLSQCIHHTCTMIYRNHDLYLILLYCIWKFYKSMKYDSMPISQL